MVQDPSPSCAADHSYTCSPDAFKRKYQDQQQKVEVLQQKVYNNNRKEKRAKLVMQAYLEELIEQRQLSEKTEQMLQAYKGMSEIHISTNK